MDDFLYMLFGVIIGGIIATAHANNASNELQNEAKKLYKLNVLLLRALENAGLAEFNRDKDDNITGMVIKLSAQLKANFSTSEP